MIYAIVGMILLLALVYFLTESEIVKAIFICIAALIVLVPLALLGTCMLMRHN